MIMAVHAMSMVGLLRDGMIMAVHAMSMVPAAGVGVGDPSAAPV